MPIYELTWRNKWLTADAQSISEMIIALSGAITDLAVLLAAVTDEVVDVDFSSAADDYIIFYTEDKEAAKELGFTEMPQDEEEDEDAALAIER